MTTSSKARQVLKASHGCRPGGGRLKNSSAQSFILASDAGLIHERLGCGGRWRFECTGRLIRNPHSASGRAALLGPQRSLRSKIAVRSNTMIELRQLRYAIATADAQSFSRAAAALNVKQIGIQLEGPATRGSPRCEALRAFDARRRDH